MIVTFYILSIYLQYPHIHHDYDRRLWFNTISRKQTFQLDSYNDAMPEKTTPYINAQASPVFNDHSYLDLYSWVQKFSGPVSRKNFKMSGWFSVKK